MGIKTEWVIENEVRTAVVTIGSEATIVNSGEIKDGLLAVLPEADVVRIDLASTSAADLSLLQLVCALHRSAMAAGKTISLSGGESGHLSDLAEAAGFARQISCFPETICLWSGGKE